MGDSGGGHHRDRAGAVGRVRRADLILGDRLGHGGQGTVYRVMRRGGAGQGDNGEKTVYKEYATGVLPTLDAAALWAMVDFLHEAEPGSADAQWLSEKTAWPSAVVEDAGAVRGFLMREVPDRYRFDFKGLTPAGARRLANVEYLLNGDAYVGSAGLRVSERDRVMLLRDLAETLARLHRMDVAVGDLSPKNLLFTLTPQPECFLIDCDAVRLRGTSVLPQAETPDWQLPAGEERATRAGDAYKFALLAVRMFARDQTSTDTVALSALSPVLSGLARAGLDPDPARRPGPAHWTGALATALATASTVTTHTNTAGTIGAQPGWLGWPPGQALPPSAPGRPATMSKRGGIVAALVCALVLVVAVVAANQHSTSTAQPLAAPTTSDQPWITPTTPNGSGATDPQTTDTIATTAYSPSPPPDPMAAAQVGSCFYDEGTAGQSDLVPTACTTGAFEVVQVFDGTTDLNSCNNVPDRDESVASTADDLVLCLSYQNAYGDAFHATQGDCVYGPDQSGATWDTEACQTGNFKVLAVYRGTTDSGKCSSWPYYDEYFSYPVASNPSLDVLLCLTMNYPDAAGDAKQYDCLLKSGNSFTNPGSCSAANVYVAGRTSVYNDPGFCGSYGWTTWENPDYPKLAYTVCWQWK